MILKINLHKKTKKNNTLIQLRHISYQLIVFLSIIFSNSVLGQDTNAVNFIADTASSVQNDSLKAFINDTLLLDSLTIDSLRIQDSLDNVVLVKESDIKEEINYSSEDSMIVDIMTQKVHIYGDAHVTYGDISLDADYIEIDWSKNLLSAKPTLDSNENEVGIPLFKEGESMYQAHEIKYNFNTEEGIIKQIVTQQGEGYVHGETVKKTAENHMYIKNAMYTTCNREHQIGSAHV